MCVILLVLATIDSHYEEGIMKERYLNMMEVILSAYTDAHIQRYFDDVKRDG